MKAYKLVRKMKDGSLSPLFINQKSRMQKGVWMQSELHIKKGFAVRQGWHCVLNPIAPHLSKKNRVWVEVEVDQYQLYNKPKHQGGVWLLAQKIKIVKEI
tara:strand:+ start:380 stop:679 length:300 start_codon:yes stop_codon:yes gene_type:complete